MREKPPKNKKTNIIGYSKGMPIIKCEERKDFPNAHKFWCEHCNEWHYHGIGPGHRASHCILRSSPFYEKGYIIIL